MEWVNSAELTFVYISDDSKSATNFHHFLGGATSSGLLAYGRRVNKHNGAADLSCFFSLTCRSLQTDRPEKKQLKKWGQIYKSVPSKVSDNQNPDRQTIPQWLTSTTIQFQCSNFKTQKGRLSISQLGRHFNSSKTLFFNWKYFPKFHKFD